MTTRKPKNITSRSRSYARKYVNTDLAEISWADGYRTAMREVRKILRVTNIQKLNAADHRFLFDLERMR